MKNNCLTGFVILKPGVLNKHFSGSVRTRLSVTKNRIFAILFIISINYFTINTFALQPSRDEDPSAKFAGTVSRCGEVQSYPVLTLHIDQTGHPINTTQYGAFFEEISHSGEGGLYAELIQNRSFEDSIDSIPGWKLFANCDSKATISLEASDLLNSAQSRALKVEKGSAGTICISNEGYWGINVVQGRTYSLTFYAKGEKQSNAQITAVLRNQEGTKIYASSLIGILDEGWKKYNCKLTASESDLHGCLAFEFTSGQAAKIWFDVVSLFPPTWKGRPNGLRPDLAEMVARMKPGVIRFPGGSYVSTLPSNSPRWLTELGPIEQRPGHPGAGKNNVWGYHNNDGFGLHEYLQFAEDLGAEPIYVFQGGSDPVADFGKPETYLTDKALDSLIKNILGGIEYANGSVNTTFGSLRASNGHPKPFRMKYVQIGNENWKKPFNDNYIKIYAAIHEKYPDIKVIWGGDWIGNNQHGYKSDGIMPAGTIAQIVDEHYYKTDNWFFENTDRFTPRYYPRGVENEAKVFLGEVSAVSDNLEGALKETAFLLGAEKYSDKVVMAVYAPLFANVNFKKWPANAIYFDNARVYGTPSYYAQLMLGNNVGDFNISFDGLEGLINNTLFVNANVIKSTGEILIKIVNSDNRSREIRIDLQGIAKLPVSGRETVLGGSDRNEGNSFDRPSNVAPVEKMLDKVGNSFLYVIKPCSFTVLRLIP